MTSSNITYTILNSDLCKPVAELVDLCFPQMLAEDKYNEEDLKFMIGVFPEGTVIAMDGAKVVGMGIGVFINIDFDHIPATENQLISTNEELKHNPDGDYYYGTDFCVHPDYRGRKIGRGIYDRRKEVIVRHNRKGFVAAAVLPGYADHKHELDIDTYLAKVVAGELFDPTLSMQLRNGFKFIRPIKDFFTYPKSDNWSALIIWENQEHK
ncbi:MAG: GNAT superfamily N-acetyltransferase [Candidatus Promineifilaceae bacterium]|jgi:GNAT superfamily N-acetyltransferase